MKSLLNKVILLLFPHYCLGCKKSGHILCSKCIETIPPPERDLPRGIYALFDYRDPLIKKALWNLKYGNVSELANIVAPQIHETILEILFEEYALIEVKNITLIPIPTSGDKSKKRSYNHAYKIAEAVVKYQNKNNNLKWKLLDPLIKIKKTERQAMVKGRNKRIKNIEGAFSVKKEFLAVDNLGVGPLKYPQSLENSFFIIIDDITTTGASINEAMRALKPLKPRHMFGITIAH